jgi:malonate-semialdehyde dehydrogenase (acetylating)/methylmalonate-semialdehyde dehydrogenase
MASGYGSAGERCMATSVAVAVGRIADELIERLAPRVRSVKIGGGMEPDLDMGPLVTAAHRVKVSGYIDAGVAAGAKLVVDDRGHTVPGHEEGFFLGGSLFDDAREPEAPHTSPAFTLLPLSVTHRFPQVPRLHQSCVRALKSWITI